MKRLDNELVDRNLFKTRSKAQQAIKSGIIYCDKKQITKCGFEVSELTNIEIKGEILKYVSRGGLKLEKALKIWNIDLKEKIMIDIGSSTGGFSDCALQNGISKVYAVDVGTEQFDKTLAQNEKINLFERTDFRKMDANNILDANFITIDVSFISVTKLVSKISDLINVKEIVCLIKPQFECGKEIADRYKGIIVDKQVHKDVIKKVLKAFEDIEFMCAGLTFSPIKGGDGNVEYLAYLKKENAEDYAIKDDDVERIIIESTNMFD